MQAFVNKEYFLCAVEKPLIGTAPTGSCVCATHRTNFSTFLFHNSLKFFV